MKLEGICDIVFNAGLMAIGELLTESPVPPDVADDVYYLTTKYACKAYQNTKKKKKKKKQKKYDSYEESFEISVVSGWEEEEEKPRKLFKNR